MQKAFAKYHVMCSYRKPESLGGMLIRSKFDRLPSSIPREPATITGLSTCSSCVYCADDLLVPCTSFTFGKNSEFTWTYTRNFTCNSKCVIYLVQCLYCWMFYIGQTKDLKPRTRKHKSDVLNPQNSICRELSEHLAQCSGLKMPYFRIYLFFYVPNESKKRFLEKRFIIMYKPPLNGDA